MLHRLCSLPVAARVIILAGLFAVALSGCLYAGERIATALVVHAIEAHFAGLTDDVHEVREVLRELHAILHKIQKVIGA